MLRLYKIIYTGVILIMAGVGCITEIPYESSSTVKRINITGQFTDQLEDQVVDIREIPNLKQGEPVIGDPIENAEVTLVSSNGEKIVFDNAGNGRYKKFTQGKIGQSYKLKVNLPGNRTYESPLVTINKNAPIDSLRVMHITESIINTNSSLAKFQRVQLVLNTTLHNGTTPINTIYRVTGEHEFKEEDESTRLSPPLRTCYLKQEFDFGNLVAISGYEIPNNKIAEKIIFKLNHDYRFLYQIGFYVDQISIDDTTFKYWNQVQKLLSIKNSLFDQPPGVLHSNIKSNDPFEQVFGYFTVGSKVTKRIFTSSVKLGLTGQNYCDITFGAKRKPECIDCRTFQGSTTTKPSYWPY